MDSVGKGLVGGVVTVYITKKENVIQIEKKR